MSGSFNIIHTHLIHCYFKDTAYSCFKDLSVLLAIIWFALPFTVCPYHQAVCSHIKPKPFIEFGHL